LWDFNFLVAECAGHKEGGNRKRGERLREKKERGEKGG
jgi:hypothetical protein